MTVTVLKWQGMGVVSWMPLPPTGPCQTACWRCLIPGAGQAHHGASPAAGRTNYRLSGSRMRVIRFTDRVAVRGPGRLPHSVSLETRRLGVPAERNRRLATRLTPLGHMSAIGTGIPCLIFRLTRQGSGREPEFARVGEAGRVRLWANSRARPDSCGSGPRAGWMGRRRCGQCCRGARLRPRCLASQAARSAVVVKSRRAGRDSGCAGGLPAASRAGGLR